MANKHKEPTNAELLKEFRSFSKSIERHERDIGVLLNWKIAVEAVDRYQAAQSRGAKVSDNADKPVDWTKIVIATLGIAGAAISVIAVMAGK